MRREDFPTLGHPTIAIKAVFVIQTMTYFITDKKLIYAQYSGNELVQSQIVADISGLIYLGSLYDRALFFSQYNRKIYQFTGDSILTEFLECNNIKEINAISYIPMSNSVIFAATENDNKQVVFIMQQGNMIRLEDVTFKRLYTTENDNDSIILVSDDKIVYINNEQYAGFTKDTLKVETCYFGIGQEQKAIFSCYYVRLYSENKLEGQIKVKTYTLISPEMASKFIYEDRKSINLPNPMSADKSVIRTSIIPSLIKTIKT